MAFSCLGQITDARMKIERLKQLSYILEAEIAQTKTDWALRFPIENYIKLIEKYPQISSYGYISKEVDNFCDELVKYTTKQALDLFHKLVLVNLIDKALETLPQKSFPQDVLVFFKLNFERIIQQIESNSSENNYSYKNDKFRKDLALCSLRLIPTGAQKIHLSGIPKGFLLKAGLPQLLKGTTFIIRHLGGFSPLFEMHTDSNDPDLMADFNQEGWIRFYRRISDILKIYPHVKGVFGSSWFFDPVLENISPRLVYLRTIATNNGGRLFRIGSNAQSIKDATLKSQARRKLYQEGKYMPTSYLLIWPRKDLIAWAEKKQIK
jgi:hypothetical protein